ncbi:MAG: hypothetical protein QOG82_2510 [Actinomycetota bacterium]|nr:hypothetical protein [Actinomycetota bacterium]
MQRGEHSRPHGADHGPGDWGDRPMAVAERLPAASGAMMVR